MSLKKPSARIWQEFLTVLACVYLAAFSYPAFINPVPSSTQNVLDYLQWTIWAVFAIDVAFGIFKAKDKLSYISTHPLEILSVALPALRPLRLLRILTFGGMVIQKVAVGRQFAITLKVFLFSLLTAFIAAVQITITEREIPTSNIKNFGDGAWWALTTITTVGYGDRFPTSTEGRVIAFLLMLIGIGLMGVVTASVAAWFVSMSHLENRRSEGSD